MALSLAINKLCQRSGVKRRSTQFYLNETAATSIGRVVATGSTAASATSGERFSRPRGREAALGLSVDADIFGGNQAAAAMPQGYELKRGLASAMTRHDVSRGCHRRIARSSARRTVNINRARLEYRRYLDLKIKSQSISRRHVYDIGAS